MTTSYRSDVERREGVLIDETPEARLGRMVAICTITALLLSFVAIGNLNASVDDLLKSKVTYMQERISDLDYNRF